MISAAPQPLDFRDGRTHCLVRMKHIAKNRNVVIVIAMMTGLEAMGGGVGGMWGKLGGAANNYMP